MFFEFLVFCAWFWKVLSIQVLNYVLHTSFRKIFRTRSTDVVLHCMHMLNCPEAEDVVLNRKRKFLIKYASLDNLICSVCQNFANSVTAAVSVVWPA